MESRKISEQLLDAAACDALGASSPTESASYQQELASMGAGDEARRIDRDLRETVARMAAASPHLAPPSDLRGRILQATAPVTFRMEDYRKATKEPSRFYKWGFYAAMLFLMAGAYYNLSMQTAVKHGNEVVAQLQQDNKQRGAALAALFDPKYQPVYLKDAQGAAYGVAYVNTDSKQAVVVLAEDCVPPGKAGQLTYAPNGQKPEPYKTVLMTAPRSNLTSIAKRADSMETMLTLKTTTPDPDAPHPLQSRPQVASEGIGPK
jgi:hypothetical protein